jgi:hypothetical protein
VPGIVSTAPAHRQTQLFRPEPIKPRTLLQLFRTFCWPHRGQAEQQHSASLLRRTVSPCSIDNVKKLRIFVQGALEEKQICSWDFKLLKTIDRRGGTPTDYLVSETSVSRNDDSVDKVSGRLMGELCSNFDRTDYSLHHSCQTTFAAYRAPFTAVNWYPVSHR